MDEKRNNNQIFIQRILENKEALFGKHSNKITQQVKNKIWDKIRTELVNAGAVTFAAMDAAKMAAKFSDMKRRTKEKEAKMKQTGTGGQVLTTVDSLILDIVGRDSAEIKGLSIADSEEAPTEFETGIKKMKMEKKQMQMQLQEDDEEEENNSEDSDVDVVSMMSSPSQPNQKLFSDLLNVRGIKPSQGIFTVEAQTSKFPTTPVQKKVQVQQQRKRSNSNTATFTIDVELKKAKLNYYNSQAELAMQQKEESAVRTEILRMEKEEKVIKLQEIKEEQQSMNQTSNVEVQVQVQDQLTGNNQVQSQYMIIR